MSSGQHRPGSMGRSTLLRAGYVRHTRRRNWIARYLALGSVLGILYLIVKGIQTDWFNPDGPARLLYILHDTVWLPVKGALWTALFPDALIWATALTCIAALAIVEFVGWKSPVRTGQLALLRLLVFRAPGVIVAWHDILGWTGLRMGLAETLIGDLRQDALFALTRDLKPGADPTLYARLCHLTELRLRLGMSRPRDLVAEIDTLGLAAFDPQHRMDHAERLADRIEKIAPDRLEPFRRFTQTRPDLPGIRDALRWAADLRTAGETGDVIELAGRVVLTARATIATGNGAFLAFFDDWARERLCGRAETVAALAEAEDLCAFAFWAASAEAAANVSAPAALFQEAFDGLRSERDRGEGFAHGDFYTGDAV